MVVATRSSCLNGWSYGAAADVRKMELVLHNLPKQSSIALCEVAPAKGKPSQTTRGDVAQRAPV